MSIFYERFVQLCAEQGVSPSGAAKAMGLSNSIPNSWKKGKIPYDATIKKVASYFGVSSEYLKGTDEPEEKEEIPAAPESRGDNESYKAILAFIATSTEEERQELINYVQFIKSKRG